MMDENDDGSLLSLFNSQRVVSGRDLYVVWTHFDLAISKSDIFFNKSVDGGQTFENAQNSSDNMGESRAPQIDIS